MRKAVQTGIVQAHGAQASPPVNSRSCGDCQLCCKLLPMSREAAGHDAADRLVRAGLAQAAAFRGMLVDFDKAAGVRCPYQRHRKGCTVYARRPFGCRAWSCRWLLSDDTGELQRPDRAHYVIDENLDYVTTDDGSTHPVVQIWVDPSFPDAHRDPVLRAFLLRRWELEGCAALVRLDHNRSAMLLWHDAEGWHERVTMQSEHEHTAEEKHAAGIGPTRESALERLRDIGVT